MWDGGACAGIERNCGQLLVRLQVGRVWIDDVDNPLFAAQINNSMPDSDKRAINLGMVRPTELRLRVSMTFATIGDRDDWATARGKALIEGQPVYGKETIQLLLNALGICEEQRNPAFLPIPVPAPALCRQLSE